MEMIVLMRGMQSGQPLLVNEEGLCNDKGELVLKFSKAFQGMLENYRANGYSVSAGTINYFVYWKGEEAEKEVEIIFPELELTKSRK